MRRRAVTWGILLALISVALVLIPGFDVLSFYFCLPMSLILSMACGGVAVTGMAEARATGRSFAAGFGRSLRASGLLLLVPLAIVIANTLRVGPCDTAYGALFYLVGPVASVAVAVALGAAASAVIRRPKVAHVAYVGLFLAPFVVNGIDLYRDPAVFFFNPFLGFFPGPIYDDRIEVTSAYVAFRGACLAAAIGVAAIGRALAGRDLQSGLDRRWGPWALAAAGLGVAFTLWGHSGEFGFRVSRADVDAELSGRATDADCDVRYAPELGPDAAARLLQDCGFRARQVAAFFGVDRGAPIRVYAYADDDQKARLMGARDVEVTKPWLGEIHLTSPSAGDFVLGHEIAHVVAGRLAGGVLALPLRWGVVPDMGVVEGLAVAAAFADDGPSPHEWALATQLAGLPSDPSDLLGGTGFVTAQAGRAYTVAGSFIRFLADTRGAAVLREIAAGGRIEAVTGVPLASLVDEWRRYLEEVAGATVDQDLVARASGRFSGPGVLGRRCPVDTARLAADAAEAVRTGDLAGGEACLREALSHNPGATRLRRELATVVAMRGDEEAAEAVLGLDRGGASGEPGAQDLVALADSLVLAAAERGEAPSPRVRAALDRAVPSGRAGAEARSIRARIAALDLDPKAGGAVFQVLAGTIDDRPDLVLAEALGRAPGSAILHYLLGRLLMGQGAYEVAGDHLAAALAVGLPDGFDPEAEKTAGRAAYWAGRVTEARHHLSRALDLAPYAGDRAVIEEYLSRVAGL